MLKIKFEKQAKSNETTLYVKRDNSHRRRRFSNSNNNMFDVSVSRFKNASRRFIKRKRKCFICEKNHFIRDCEWLDKFKTYMKKKSKKKIFKKIDKKSKNQKHQVYVAEKNIDHSWKFDSNLNDFEKKEIVVLFKKMINKISKNTWIVDFDVTISMIDDFSLFNDSLKFIRRRDIKIEKNRLYSNKYDMTRVTNKKNKSCLITTLYVSNLKVNFLSIRRLCEMKVKNHFDKNVFRLVNKSKRLVVRISICNDVYVIDKISNALNEKTLIANMIDDVKEIIYEINDEIISFEDELDLNNFETSFKNQSKLSSKLKLYRLWHKRYAHMSKIKLRNLHKIITLKKSISIVENDTSCQVCCTIKLINARSRKIVIRKSHILALMFIDICEELSTSWQEYTHFLKIVDNHSRKTWIIFLKKRVDVSKALRK